MNDQIQLIELWEKVLEKLQPTITPLVYNTWFKTVLPLQIVDNTFEIGVQKQFIQEWLEINYQKVLQEMLNSISSQPLQLKIINLDIQEPVSHITETFDNNINISYSNDPYNNQPTVNIKPNPIKENNYNTQPIDQNFADEIESSINPKYVFETFVTGGSNNFAHAASIAVTEQPGKVYNPLFLYGGVGLGDRKSVV